MFSKLPMLPRDERKPEPPLFPLPKRLKDRLEIVVRYEDEKR